MCEEAPQGYSYGARAKMKNRFIGGVVTPAQPQYLYGMVDDRADAHDFVESPPILGIAAAVGGYKVCAHARRYVPRFVAGSLCVPVPCLCLCLQHAHLCCNCTVAACSCWTLPCAYQPILIASTHFTLLVVALPALPHLSLPCPALL